METVSPSERYRWELEESLAGTGRHEYPIELIDRLAARLISQQALDVGAG
jgi:hypothetical protein